MSKSRYKNLLAMELEQLDTCRKTSHNRYHEVIDKQMRALDANLLDAITRERMSVGDDLLAEDRHEVNQAHFVDVNKMVELGTEGGIN